MTETLCEKLEAVARHHDQTVGFTPRLIACRDRTLSKVLPPGPVLDLGCGDGLLTARLAARHSRVVGVDASDSRLERSRRNTRGLPNVELRQALFEDCRADPDEQFDGVVLSCVLEHVADPVALLRQAASWLSPQGRVVAIVPHAGSVHRRAGVLMGLITELTDPGEADRALEHDRVYTRAMLAADVEGAGLRVTASGGHLLKALANDRMAELPADLVDAYEELGRQFPDLAAEIYAVGELG